MEMLKNRYKFFSELFEKEAISNEYDKRYLFFDACKDRVILGIHFEEYFRDKYYSLPAENRKNFNYYFSLAGLAQKDKLRIFFDYMLCRAKMNIRVEEYFRNYFFKLQGKERKTYLTTGIKNRMMQLCNDKTIVPEIDDKVKFNQNFSDYMQRDWIEMENCTKKDFLEYTQNHPESFCKYSDGLQGIGARKIDFKKEFADEFFLKFSGKRIIVEEIIKQHHELAEFNSSTVNTLRVLSFVRADGSVAVLRAALRMGRANEIADNFHMHGIAANVDVETGIVMSEAVEAHFKRYIKHPDSGKIIPGFQIPYWDKVLAVVTDAAKRFPQVRYIGWDVAIRENDICLVEGNSTACPDVIEMPIRKGAWQELKPLVNEVAELLERKAL